MRFMYNGFIELYLKVLIIIKVHNIGIYTHFAKSKYAKCP